MNQRRLLIALLLTASAALVQGAQPPAQAASFICGGIGQPEAQALKAQAPGHDLMLTFAQTGGAYLADVAFRITDQHGRIALSGTCDGPIMLVDLPVPGRWKVSADVNGVTRQTTVATTRGHTARITMLWPASD